MHSSVGRAVRLGKRALDRGYALNWVSLQRHQNYREDADRPSRREIAFNTIDRESHFSFSQVGRGSPSSGEIACSAGARGALVGQFIRTMVQFPPWQSAASGSPEQMLDQVETTIDRSMCPNRIVLLTRAVVL